MIMMDFDNFVYFIVHTRHGVSFLEVSQCFQLVLGVLDACLLALVVVIEAHSVSHMCPEMPRPQLRVILEVIL